MIPQMVEFEGKIYEARTHHKDTGIPYYPDFDLGAMRTTLDNVTRFRYRTVLRINTKGVYYDVQVSDAYEIDQRNLEIDPHIQIQILHKLMSRFTQAVNSAQLLYRTDNDKPSDYQLDERIRTILLYHRADLQLIKTLPEHE